VIETRAVEVVAYDEVTEVFAATEGEFDGSLRYWREAHRAYFGRQSRRIGKEADVQIPVVCEKTVWCRLPARPVTGRLASNIFCRRRFPRDLG
jgi:hypothetical protein